MRDYWYVYIVRCRDGLYYTGITNDVAKRIKDHNSGKGAPSKWFIPKNIPISHLREREKSKLKIGGGKRKNGLLLDKLEVKPR